MVTPQYRQLNQTTWQRQPRVKMNENFERNVAIQLIDINAVKFGDFVMKSGINSPIYFDLRVTISNPLLMENIATLLWDKVKTLPCDVVCGVPYTALPFATCISLKQKIPMVMRRKETKSHGTKQRIEGIFAPGQKCLVVEDVVTSGSSVMETVRDLKEAGLEVSDAVVLLDREQGGKDCLAKQGITLHSVYTIGTMLGVLQREKKIGGDVVKAVEEYLASSQFSDIPTKELNTRVKMSFESRRSSCKNEVGRRLFDLMIKKKSNLCISADLTSCQELLKLAEAVGSEIVLLKTHADILQDFDKEFISRLTDLAEKYQFLILEDRKYSDIGYTVEKQYLGGIYTVSDWADLVTVHAISGPGILKGLKKDVDVEKRGCFLVVQMSSAGNLISQEYTSAAMNMIKEHEDFVAGVICQSSVSDNPGLLHLMPGVKLEGGGDNLGQSYMTPREAILDCSADIIIVGRGITSSSDPRRTAEEYRSKAYEAYDKRLH